MKYIICKLGCITLCLTILISSCSDRMVDPDPNPGGSGEKMVPLLIKMKDLASVYTYGTDYLGVNDVQGSNWEDSIKDVTLYIFDNIFKCEKIVTVQSPLYFGYVGPVMVKTGYKNLIAVVNASTSNITLPTIEASTTYNGLLTMLTDPITTLPESPFLMTGKLLNVSLPDELPITSPYDTTLYVERACAKITMNVTKSNQATNHNIELTKISMYQGANQVALFEAPSSNTIGYTTSASSTSFNPSTGIVPNKGSGYCAMADSFYTYESLCGSDKSKAVRLVLEATVNSSNTRTAEFYLGEYSVIPGDTTYDILRNYWYVVNVDIIKPGLDSIYVTVTATPWNVADTVQKIEGAGGVFTPAKPFKLVKNLTYAEMILPYGGGTWSWGAIEGHSKGASWIDFTVTEGTTWTFDVRDNTPRNQNVYYCLESDRTTWLPLPATGTGDDAEHRIYFYRPYRENDEPPLGPTLKVTLNNIHKQDFIIEQRDTLPIPTNSFVLRPQLTGAPVNETRVYIPLAGVFSHWENELSSANVFRSRVPITADVLWKDHPTDDVVKNVSVINASNPDSAYIYAEAGAPGNAVIAMRLNTSPDTIYWTFHIWVTEYNPYEAAGQKFYLTDSTVMFKNVFMDRDLGAMSNTWDGGNGRGLFYQYGRKDPFPRSGPTNTRSATLTPASPDFRPKTALGWAIQNPNYFITRTSGEDWTIYQENPDLWISPGGNKSAYDPCPEGWRIPVMPENVWGYFPWDGVLIDPGPYDPDKFNNSIPNGWYSPLVGFYPKSGYINSSGALANSGTYARFWTTYSASTNMAIGLQLDDNALPVMGVLDKALGASVRCVVDKNYILNVENGGLFGTGINNLKNVLLP